MNNPALLKLIQGLHKESYTRFLLTYRYQKKTPTRKERQQAIKRFLDKTRCAPTRHEQVLSLVDEEEVGKAA